MKLTFRSLAILSAVVFFSLALIWMFAPNLMLSRWGVHFSSSAGLMARRGQLSASGRVRIQRPIHRVDVASINFQAQVLHADSSPLWIVRSALRCSILATEKMRLHHAAISYCGFRSEWSGARTTLDERSNNM
jgi:hypothetical protein